MSEKAAVRDEDEGEPWTQELQEFADMWWRFSKEMRRLLRTYGDDDLRALMNACEKPTSTNCWYATAQVAPLVKREASALLYQRKRERETGSRSDG